MVSSVTDPSRKDLEEAFFGDEPAWLVTSFKALRPGKVFLLEQVLGVKLEALEKKKIRLNNDDLDRMLDALMEKTDSREKYEEVLNE